MHDPPGQGVVGEVFDVVPMCDDPHVILRRNEDVLGASQMGPLPKEFSLRIKNLDAIVLAVAHIDRALGIDRHRMWNLKVTGAFAGFAPGK